MCVYVSLPRIISRLFYVFKKRNFKMNFDKFIVLFIENQTKTKRPTDYRLDIVSPPTIVRLC